MDKTTPKSKTPTENIDALRTLINGNRGALELLTVFEDADAAQKLLSESQARLTKLRAEEAALRMQLAQVDVALAAKVQADTTARAEADAALVRSVAAAEKAAGARIDAATAQALKVEGESQARINEATAKANVAETALKETTAQYERVQAALHEIKTKLA